MYRKNNSSKPKQPCVNPVFERWIIEWREDAIARDLPSKHTLWKVKILITYSILKKYLETQQGRPGVIFKLFYTSHVFLNARLNVNKFLAIYGKLHVMTRSKFFTSF